MPFHVLPVFLHFPFPPSFLTSEKCRLCAILDPKRVQGRHPSLETRPVVVLGHPLFRARRRRRTTPLVPRRVTELLHRIFPRTSRVGVPIASRRISA